jgi:hypothetical protein
MNKLAQNVVRGLSVLPLAATVALSVGCGQSQSQSGAPPVLTGTYQFATFDGPTGAPTTVNGINNDGTVVGFTTSNMVNANFLRTSDGKITALDVGDAAAMANAVNVSGAVVGVANSDAVLLMNGAPSTLTPPGAMSSAALGISDDGVIVGQFVDATMATPGFVDQGGTFTTINPTAKSTVTNVQGINNNGLAIGFYTEDGTHQHGFLYDTTSKKVTLLADPSTARTMSGGLVLTQFLSINDSDQAVGYYQTTDGSQYGFAYDVATSTYRFLDHPQAAPFMGVQVTQITGIDDAGEIAGFFVDASGAQHGFVAPLDAM